MYRSLCDTDSQSWVMSVLLSSLNKICSSVFLRTQNLDLVKYTFHIVDIYDFNYYEGLLLCFTGLTSSIKIFIFHYKVSIKTHETTVIKKGMLR